MGDRFPEFMRTDLTRLTWTGWLLLLITLGAVAVSGLALVLLALLLGIPIDQGHRWVMAVLLIVALAAGAGVFESGKRLLAWAGFPILRPIRRGSASRR